MSLRDFVKNYDDMSDDNGFQFKFHCDICGDGYLSTYRPAPFAKARSVMGAVESLGGVFGRLSGTRGAADALHDAKWREAKEKAFDQALAEAKAHFTKCPSCAKYVDVDCWNDQAQMCVDCAPRQAVVVQKAKANAFVSQAQEAMSKKDYSAEIASVEESTVLCPNCGKPTGGGKFCEACGAPLDKKLCPNCGAKISVTARFCNNCGNKLS